MSSTNCREIEARLACFTDAAGASRTIVSHSLYDADGRIVATYYTDEGSVDALDTSTGTVISGACALGSGTTTVEFPDPEPRTASFSSQLTTGGNNGTVPANTYSITVFNDSNDTIQVSVGGDVQIIPRRSSHNWFRDFETEQPFTAGAATVTALSGTLNANERVIFNFKEIS